MDATPDPLAALKFFGVDFRDRIESELRQGWQARVLLASSGRMYMCVLSVLSHNFDDAMLTLLQVLYPGFYSIKAPFLCTAARVLKNGNVVADVVTKGGKILKWVKLFEDEKAMETAFRHLADDLKLNDQDRRELFAAVKRWVVCDYRIDPNMNPMDPDAKRLVVH